MTIDESSQPDEATEFFVQSLAKNQGRLQAYIFSLVGDLNQATDVLQETNLVLWRKHGEYRPAQPFLPWAFAIARYQVLAHLRDRKRDRHVIDAELLDAVSASVAKESERLEVTTDALRACLEQLDETKANLVRSRYFRSMSIDQLAQSASRSISDIKVTLFRIRKQLAKCIELRLASEAE